MKFFESNLGHKPSFVWRIICNSKCILKVGSRWSIRDSTSIPVRQNDWIANDISLCPQNVDDSSLDDLRVFDFILLHSKECNAPLLNSVFL